LFYFVIGTSQNDLQLVSVLNYLIQTCILMLEL